MRRHALRLAGVRLQGRPPPANDMVGYANDDLLDNTIRYSSAAVHDLQHAAALLFTDLILYDAHY